MWNRTRKNFAAVVLIVIAPFLAGAESRPPASSDHHLELDVRKTNILQVATTADEALLLAQGGAGQPEVALIGLALPPKFNARERTPILFTSVTGDPYQSNIKEMEVYRKQAIARGWIVVTGQPHPWPDRSRDTVTGRQAAARAAFRTLAEIIPASRNWPTAFAGFSGGSKMAQMLAGDAIAEGRHVVGALMSGCNENMWAQVIDAYDPDRTALKKMGYFLSSGRWDQISTLAQMKDVRRGLRKKGARHVRLEYFDGQHAHYLPHIDAALAWFEELAGSRRPANKSGN